MKPVIIFRHALTEGPGYLAEFLDNHNIPWRLHKIDEGEALPVSLESYSGMVMMGGPMSVNDDLPWMPPLLRLIREAIEMDIPLLGHCLGGQLISKALGAAVTQNPVKEIGWDKVAVNDNADAQSWFGDLQHFVSFHWHGETFALPPGVVHLLSSRHCANQAYALGKHLAFQCHIEMTADMVETWCRVGADEIEQSAASPGVQQVEEIRRDLHHKVGSLNTVAEQVYTRWIAGLAR